MAKISPLSSLGKHKSLPDPLLAAPPAPPPLPPPPAPPESLQYTPRLAIDFSVTRFVDLRKLSQVSSLISGRPGHSFENDVDVPYLGSVPILIRAITDFYVYCLAESTNTRLFNHFPDADACVVITHPDKFKLRVSNTIFGGIASLEVHRRSGTLFRSVLLPRSR